MIEINKLREVKDTLTAARDTLEHLREVAAQAIARAESAERAESRLRDEMGSAFRKHGLAAGPQAVDALVTRAEAAEAKARVCDVQAEASQNSLKLAHAATAQSEAEVARLRGDVALVFVAIKLDCGDNSCLFAESKTGMRTNGGCRCLGRKSVIANREIIEAYRRLSAARPKGDDE